MVKVFLIEDVPLYRQGLRCILEQLDDCQIVGEALLPQEILQGVLALHPEVIFLHADLRTAQALEIARLLYEQGQRGLFVLAEQLTEEQLFALLLLGAAAYEPRRISPTALIDKLRRVSRGEILLSGDVLDTREQLLPSLNLAQEPGSMPEANRCPLTQKEMQVLLAIARGLSIKRIARQLAVSQGTVRRQIASLLRSLGVTDRTAAVMEAWRQNWLMPADLLASPQMGRYEQPSSTRLRKRTERMSSPGVQLPSEPHIHYRLQRTFCSKTRCRQCRAGIGHGPYWYAYEQVQGRSVRRYVGKTLPAGVTVD